MENKITVGEFVRSQIKKKGVTKSFVYKGIGVTTKGFDLMLDNNTFTFNRYVEICNLLQINPSLYFISPDGGDENFLEPVRVYGPDSDKKEAEKGLQMAIFKDELIEFQQKQIDKLTETINTLSKLIEAK